MKSSVAKHDGCKRARHCGPIANGRNRANRDFSCVRNCWFAYCSGQALAKRGCKAVQVLKLARTCIPFGHQLARTCIDLHMFKFSCKSMQVYHRLATQSKSMQVDASFSAVIETFQPIKCPNFPGNDGVLWCNQLLSIRFNTGVEAPLTPERNHETEFVEFQLKGKNSLRKNRATRKSIGGDVVNNRKQSWKRRKSSECRRRNIYPLDMFSCSMVGWRYPVDIKWIIYRSTCRSDNFFSFMGQKQVTLHTLPVFSISTFLPVKQSTKSLTRWITELFSHSGSWQSFLVHRYPSKIQ